MANGCFDSQSSLINRLQRLEGQVRGVRRMIEEGRDCPDILTQMAAIRGAAHQVSVMVVKEYATKCLVDPDPNCSPEETIAKVVTALSQMPC
jgi:DNA-binding FrmR family transcriptional regulator